MQGFREVCLDGSTRKGTDGRCLVIGEVAQTHDGSLGLAHSFIDAIADAGADAVKFQTHIADAESTRDEPWRVKFSPYEESRFEYWKRMEFRPDEWAGLKKHADDRGILFMSSPFSTEAVELLSRIGMRVWKIASGEVSNPFLLDLVTSTGDPVILSTGMSGLAELKSAVKRIEDKGNHLAILQCTSAYPCPPEKVGLNQLETLRSEFGCPVGLSDHSGNIYTGLAAATLGAEVIEVHVALSKEMFGPDVPASITTSELSQLVEGTRWIEKVIASPVDKEELAAEMEPLRKLFTKSVYAGSDLTKGSIVTEGMIRFKKPGTGLPAQKAHELIGKRLIRDIAADQMIQLDDVSEVD
ncbi:MAG: N-acetylneuraminate synthase [Acidobacteria bacterium]|nr:MAG: N-acetylneuraminate synthase [Acidobacteriota bacterium]REK03096.1 MAG: N-acetylneuraminate synthase [Acidobacteriota bacterium]REK15444.1 MAG: N-acetylneuraminate synthase [Acidobacteriota bacterium]REK45795.1 MAG: N-acetylneuraminate synthase [Acidobacteriota bacterium]